MGNSAALNLEGLISKSQLRKEVRRSMIMHDPEVSSLVTEKVLNKALIFISGYIKCMQYHGVQPINVDEVKHLLMDETISWIEEYVLNGGN